jgi:hypothetical protein
MYAKKLWIVAGICLAVISTPVEAAACSIFLSEVDRTPAAEWRRARQTVKDAVVIADVEVVRPYIRGQQTALLKAYRVLKGPEQATFEVDAPTSCSQEFDRQGERLRVVLRGGPDVYFEVDPGLIWQVDRLIGSDRRRDWPYTRGIEPPIP